MKIASAGYLGYFLKMRMSENCNTEIRMSQGPGVVGKPSKSKINCQPVGTKKKITETFIDIFSLKAGISIQCLHQFCLTLLLERG